MSIKTNALSKNKKAAPKKPVKKIAPKNRDKNAVATKKVVKASKPSKPVAAKKVVKKAVKAPVKKSTPVKAKSSKPTPAKKVVKTVKSAAKKASKPVAAAKSAKKAIKKAAPSKKVMAKGAKTAGKAVAVKATAKKSATKTPIKGKPVAAVKSKVAPAKKTTPVAKPAAKTSKAKAVVVKNQDLKPAQVSAAPVNKEKAPVIKAEKAQKIPTAKPAKPVVKKSIVAPITFRQEDPGPAKFMKEPNGKFEMEFVIRASEDMVFEFVSTESGLSEWFCDDVTIRNGVFTFSWDGQEQQAKLVKELPPSYIRYQWMDKNDGSYFEFKTQKDELTNDISLIITDFASDKSDEDSARLLWNSQVDKLLHVLGSFF